MAHFLFTTLILNIFQGVSVGGGRDPDALSLFVLSEKEWCQSIWNPSQLTLFMSYPTRASLMRFDSFRMTIEQRRYGFISRGTKQTMHPICKS